MKGSTQGMLEDVQNSLHESVCGVFSTMLNITTVPIEPAAVNSTEEMVAGSVGFAGSANGVVFLHFKSSFARLLAGRLLDLSEPQLKDDAIVDDAVGEISNMVVGSVKSRLCDSGYPCVLTVPSIVRGQRLKVNTPGSHARKLLGFQCEQGQFIIELLLKQESSHDSHSNRSQTPENAKEKSN